MRRGARRPQQTADGPASHQQCARGHRPQTRPRRRAVCDRELGGDAVEPHDVGDRHRDIIGERAVAIDADDLGTLAEVGAAGPALEAVPANDVSLGRHQVPDLEESRGPGLAAQLGDLAGELVPDDDRRPESSRRPAVPLPDVQVGAADAGVAYPDEDVVRPSSRAGNVPQGHAGAGRLLHESSHRCRFGWGRQARAGSCSSISRSSISRTGSTRTALTLNEAIFA